MPVNRVVTLDVTAPPWDVIHSWWIPKLGGKLDAIPGRVNHTWFQAKKVGVYHGQCAELCGLQHAAMLATVEVMSRADFDAWLASRRSGGGDLGKETWDGVCAKCHRLSGSKLVGPDLAGNATLADSSALTLLVRNGRGRMPPVGRHWPDEQLNALLAYAKKEQKSGG